MRHAGLFLIQQQASNAGGQAARQILLSCQRFQSCVQTALMACCLVLVDDFLVSDTVDNRYGVLQNHGCCSLVATSDCLASSFDCCAQGRTLAGVVQVLLNCLTSTLTCLCGICHLYFLKRGRECLRGINKPDRDAEFCKATDYNRLLKNRQTALASVAILSQESTFSDMTGSNCRILATFYQAPKARSCGKTSETLLLNQAIPAKLRLAFGYRYNAAP